MPVRSGVPPATDPSAYQQDRQARGGRQPCRVREPTPHAALFGRQDRLLLPQPRRGPPCRVHKNIHFREVVLALRANQQVLLETLDFRVGKRSREYSSSVASEAWPSRFMLNAILSLVITHP